MAYFAALLLSGQMTKIPFPLLRSLAATFVLFHFSACATKQASPPAPDAATARAQTAPKKLFLYSWIDGIANIFPKKAKPPAAVTPPWAGEIRMVNSAERFVLVESGSSASAIPGETYIAIGKNTETATLRMTALKNPPFLIADILTGDPSAGDKIYLPKPTSAPANPLPPSPVAPAAPNPTPQTEPVVKVEPVKVNKPAKPRKPAQSNRRAPQVQR